MGQPKQLLQWQDTNLLRRMIDIAMKAVKRPVVVVLGANACELQAAIGNSKADLVYNAVWQEGIASSIRCGLSSLLQLTPDLERVIFMVCDQPFVTVELLQQLVALQKESGKKIVAAKYADTMGIPAVFDNSLFPELLKLQGDTGAKKIIQQHAAELITIDFPLGHIDIDTKEDFERLQ